MALRGIAAGYPQIKSVNFIEYFHTKEVFDDLTEQHVVAVKLNAHVYIGKYYGVDQAEAYNKAKDVVKGFLVKSGCFDPDTRLPNVPYREYGFEAPPEPPPLTDVTPNPINWGNITYSDGFTTYGTDTQQVTGISVPITLALTNQTNSNIDVWYKVSSTGTVGASYEIQTTGYTLLNNGTFSVDPNYYVTFLAAYAPGWRGSPTSVNVNIVNTSDSNTLLDSFTVSVSPF